MTKEVLVVDDQLGIRLLLQEVFTNEGYQVTTVKTGKEALDNLFNKEFDLVMLDYKLPVIDGIEVLRKMNENDITTPAIVMSGLPDDISRETEQYSPVKKILAKPFNVQEVCDFTKHILE